MYTAVFTRILGSQHGRIEVPCQTITAFSGTTDFFNDTIARAWTVRRFSTVVSHCPDGTIISAQRHGEYIVATLHRTKETN